MRQMEAVMTEWSTPSITLNILTRPGGPRPPKVSALSRF